MAVMQVHASGGSVEDMSLSIGSGFLRVRMLEGFCQEHLQKHPSEAQLSTKVPFMRSSVALRKGLLESHEGTGLQWDLVFTLMAGSAE